MKRTTLISILAVLLIVGCAAQNYQVHPGSGGYVSGAPTATQVFASQSYDSLVAADSVIQATRADFLASKFPPAAMPAIKAAFNAAVDAYNGADNAWLAFNQTASAGGTPAQDVLAAALGGLTSSIAQLTALRVAK